MNRKKRSNLQAIISRRQHAEFVGRGEELTIFRENLARSWDDDQRMILFNVWGQGGIGKSTLLARFRQLATEADAVTALTDEGETDIPSVMARFSEQLKEQGHELRQFDERYKVYRQKREELEADPNAPQGFTTFAAHLLTKTGVRLARRVPVGGAVFDLVDEDALATQVSDWAAYAIRKLGNKDEVRLVLEPIEVLTPLFLEGLQDIADKQTIILFFDTYERTSPYLDNWLCDILDGRFGDVPADIVFVIAGREELDRNQWLPYASVTARLPLEPFTEEEARDYLTRKGITNEQVIAVILQLSGRFPLLVATLAAEGPNEVSQLNAPGSTAITRFLKWVPEPKRQEAALNAALPEHFNRDVLVQLIEEKDVDELFHWLKGMPFVQERTEGWKYHDVVRMQMLRHKRRESPEMWVMLHSKLTAYYSGLCASLELDAKQAWRDAMWQEYSLRKLYHLLCQSPHTHLSSALNGFLDALKANLEFARRLAAILHQVGYDINSDELIQWGNSLRVGLLAYELGENDETLAMFNALSTNPQIQGDQRATALAWRGRVRQRMKQYAEALNDFNEAIKIDPENISAITYRGVNYVWLRQYGEALVDFDRAVELDPQYPLALAERGANFMRLGRNQEALEDLDRAIELDPKYSWSFRIRGLTYSSMRRYKEALADLNLALELNPQDKFVLSSRGTLHREMGNFSESSADFDQLVAQFPNDPWALIARGTNYMLLKRHDEALADFNQALQIDPTYPWAINQRAWNYLQVGREEEALMGLNQGIALHPKTASLFGTRGVTYWRMGRYTEALGDLAQAINTDSRFAWAFMHRGRCYRLLGRYEEAFSDLNKGIELDPKITWGFAQRGMAYLETQQYDKGLQDLNYALESNPDAEWWHYIRALAYQMQGRSEDADIELAQAIQIASESHEKDPKDWRISSSLAVFYVKAGQLNVAQALFQECVTDGVPLSMVREMLYDMNTLLVLFPEHADAKIMREFLQKYLQEKSGQIST